MYLDNKAKVGNPCFSIRPPADRTISEMKRIKAILGAGNFARDRRKGRWDLMWREREAYYFSQNMQVMSGRDAKKARADPVFGILYLAPSARSYMETGKDNNKSEVVTHKQNTRACKCSVASGVALGVGVCLLVVAHVLSEEVHRHHQCLSGRYFELRQVKVKVSYRILLGLVSLCHLQWPKFKSTRPQTDAIMWDFGCFWG